MKKRGIKIFYGTPFVTKFNTHVQRTFNAFIFFSLEILIFDLIFNE